MDWACEEEFDVGFFVFKGLSFFSRLLLVIVASVAYLSVPYAGLR